MLKSEARKIYTQKRDSSTPQQRMKWEDLILIQFQNLALPEVNILFAYAAMNAEVNTDPIVDFMHFKNPALIVTYPVCNFSDYTMEAHEANMETTFVKNKFGTWEPESSETVDPESIDLVIVPLLCFDKSGYRVGYGKGFYDKYLARMREDAIKVGLSFYEPIDQIEDHNEFDIPLNYCVTPERIYEF